MDQTQKYRISNITVNDIFYWYRQQEIAIPEIQRPFVWDSTQVRDLFDSLYQGYPIGYLIVWKNPNVRLKDGGISEGKKILIDGQQRIMSLLTAILGIEIINKNYKKQRIVISFNPQTEKFEVYNPAIAKDPSWITDIGPIIRNDIGLIKSVQEYLNKNPNANRNQVEIVLEKLRNIINKPIGVVELSHDLDIETVTEIFIRINSKGMVLNQADFAMSKIASNETYNGPMLRRCIDYFCRASTSPEFIDDIKRNDPDFANSEFFKKIKWLRNETDELYDPGYADLLRVAFTLEFNRGRLADLVSLLSGRNFETKTYEEEIVKESFNKLKNGVLNFINETNFKRFIMIIKSAGFITPDMIRSKNVLNFAYILYLKLRSLGYNPADIEKYVRKWVVLSILTDRYSASLESQIDFDIRNIATRRFEDFLADVESAQLSDAFWKSGLVQKLKTSVSSSPYFNVYLAAQVKFNDKGFLSRDITVKDLILQKGDIHHIFPKEYLKSRGMKRDQYNQIANYCYTQSEINIKIKNSSPKEYFSVVFKQCKGGKLKLGGIDNIETLKQNLEENCVPEEIKDMEFEQYEDFLEKRRALMAKKIKEYYYSL
ncbi:MAG: DUF262 domain-containing protein [candidate division WOR-3 bacterium]|nr:DUF262 domain-containing protein [candidate division WOR-3 bacterium]